MKKITKLDIPENPSVESAATVEQYGSSVWDSLFKMSIADDHLSPNVGYWIAGDILDGPTVGEPVRIMRYIRNGAETTGLFYTSRVVSIDGDYFTTKNSIYKIEEYE